MERMGEVRGEELRLSIFFHLLTNCNKCATKCVSAVHHVISYIYLYGSNERLDKMCGMIDSLALNVNPSNLN